MGFGNLGGEFWLGLEKIYHMTGYEVNELLFELVDWEGTQADAHYDYFGIGSEAEGYVLNLVSGYSGLVGDSLTYEAGMKFTTKDKDEDAGVGGSCTTNHQSAWWYRDCTQTNPTGVYHQNSGDDTTDYTGIYWLTWRGYFYSLKELRMMIRPRV